MNLPNLITIGRFFLIPIYFLLFFSNHPYNTELAFLVLVVAGLSDMLDGYLARKYEWVTQIGILLDPLADKLMMISVILSFLIAQMISWWAAAVFFIRDIGMIVSAAFFHVKGKKPVPANLYGKITTVLFYIAFLLIMFRVPYAEPFLWGVIVFAFITSSIYYVAFRKINRMVL